MWAVGGSTTAQRGGQSLLEHWDGIRWTRVREPTLRYGALLYGASAVSTDDVWAVGYQGTSQGFESAPLTEHWDGTTWSVVPAPSPSQVGQNLFNSVAAISADDAWAVGDGGNGPFIEHWDGAAWTIVTG